MTPTYDVEITVKITARVLAWAPAEAYSILAAYCDPPQAGPILARIVEVTERHAKRVDNK